jgi:excisionase family DNA binding protein
MQSRLGITTTKLLDTISPSDWRSWAVRPFELTALTTEGDLSEGYSSAAQARRLDTSGVHSQGAALTQSARQESGLFDNEWLNTEQAAKFLGIPVASLRNMTSNGRVRYYKLGCRNRYRLLDLHGLLLSEKRGS